MARTVKAPKRKSRGPCSAPGCERGSAISTPRGLCCNVHYLRLLAHASFDLPERTPSRIRTCAECGATFDRGYAINAARSRRPQFCSSKCSAAASRHRALARLAPRFWKQVSIGAPDDCWLWTGRKGRGGYGAFDWGGRPHIASRFAYAITKGDPGELFVCHKCDNPPCCNPAHLFRGTHADNMQDASRKGRMKSNGLRGEEHGCAKLTAAQVLVIRASSLPKKALATRYQVTTAAIYNIQRRKTWRHV